MKRKYIKPVTTVLMVETQNNYCAATSNQWVVGTKFDDHGQVEVENRFTDCGYLKRTRTSRKASTILGTATTGSPRGLRPSATTTYYN